MTWVKHSKQDFEQMVSEYGRCAEENDCGRCQKLKSCLRHWSGYSGETRAFSYFNPTARSKSKPAEPKYDTTLASGVLRRYFPGVF